MQNNKLLISGISMHDNIMLSNGKEIIKSFFISSNGDWGYIDNKDANPEEFFSNSLSLTPILPYLENKEILLVGYGNSFILPPDSLKKYLSTQNINLEWISTPNAIHTFNFFVENYHNCLAIIFI